MQTHKLTGKLNQTADETGFSGTIAVKIPGSALIVLPYGFAQRENRIANKASTSFGTASGGKLFTAVSICQLAETGALKLEGLVSDYLNLEQDFPHFSREITIHHLLTHSSGIGDYFDEEAMDDFEQLWEKHPMYRLRRPGDFIPLIRELPMKFTPGGRFHYNNAGYIVLGLILERVAGMPFADYVESRILQPCRMTRSGYFPLDGLPADTATGYIEEEDGAWRSNIYSIPVKGGADGGIFLTAPDMLKFWDALMGGGLLGADLLARLLSPQIADSDGEYYGYGIWITQRDGTPVKYHIMGSDPGVSFRSAFYPESGLTLAVTCNQSRGAYRMMRMIEEELLAEGLAGKA
ncbi:CubicO group peptidase (beta-lactamase class C family) [Paenibacillus forsythiae]|uniref:CubicO group peptidase (Beta-lactamase class C family) n=1 Tax=Paenibacillus forsythiae TaxID=365616 RepID=A0ABU3H9W2_9BACL|nr:serine hydrolase [Paenibacillus forsythiae]MDT3427536.1 CubicO group peptidase (beta-lactamase class C family) [Paenibacillus forsythiae]